MRDSPRSPKAKTNGSSLEGNRIINPHSRIPKKTNKQTNERHGFYLILKPSAALDLRALSYLHLEKAAFVMIMWLSPLV
jgi:hypothetical protein